MSIAHFRKIFMLSLVLAIAPSLAYGGVWKELPETTLKNSSVVQKYSENFGPLNRVIGAWGGGVLDTRRDQLVIWGGGHGDSARNEIYAFSLKSGKWLRLTDGGPLPVDKGGRAWPKNRCIDEMPIGSGDPVARHPYGNMAYIAHADRLFAYGGSRACGSGGFGNDTWTFSFSEGTWKKMNPSGSSPGRKVLVAQYDEQTKLVWVRSKEALYTYDFDDNAWSQVGKGYISGLDKSSGAIDTKRRQFVIVGPSGVWTIDLDGFSKNAEKIETTGANLGKKGIARRSPGFDYDPKLDRFVLWAASDVDETPGTVYFLDWDKKEWTMEKPAGGPRGSGARGTFGRWRYAPNLDAFVGVNSVGRNIFLFASKDTPTLQQLAKSEQSSAASGESSIAKAAPIPAQMAPSSEKAPPVVNSPAPAKVASTNVADRSTPLDIPQRTWIARKPAPRSIAYSSKGKHGRVISNPVDGKLYLFSGDGGGERKYSVNSGRQEMATYDIRTDTWEKIQAYCRKDRGLQPMGPDEVGFAFDTKRNVFWHNPGFGHYHGKACRDGKPVRMKVLSYDPVTRLWKDENRTTLKQAFRETLGNHRFAVYDPVKDALIGLRGRHAYVYTIADDEWNRISISSKIRGDEYLALDLEGRHIYVVENRNRGHLYRYDIDDEDLDDLGPLPASATRYKESQAHWDSVNKVLLWPFWTQEESPQNDNEILMLYVYHPDTEQWEEIPIEQPTSCPSGLNCTVRGRHSAYDPINNVLLVMRPKGGGKIRGPAPVFLYRYGGKGKTPPPPIKSVSNTAETPATTSSVQSTTKTSKSTKPVMKHVRPSSPTDLIIIPGD